MLLFVITNYGWIIMKIGSVTLDNEFALAPMAGFTEVAFRSICSEAGAGLTVTEMVSAKGLIYGSENTEDLLYCEDNESPKAVQLFSNEPEVIYDACQHPDLQKFDIIDINMGCPVPKVVKNNMGSAMLRTPDIASKVVRACVDSTDKPITVKMRIGIKDMPISPIDFARLMQDSGASALTVHGRTREQMYMGESNWQVIDEIARSVDIPVFGNGDINSAEMAREKLNTTHCSGIAIGRGALGNPWMFGELANHPYTLDPMTVIKKHIDIMLKYFPSRIVFPLMRRHFGYYIRSRRNSKTYRDQINRSQDYDEIMSLLAEAFKDN